MAERRAVHAVAGDVLTIDDDVTEIDADPIPDLALFCNAGIASHHRLLNRDGEVDGVDHAGKLHQRAVAREFHDAPVMLGGLRFEQLSAMGLELGKGPGFVASHKTAVSDHVGGNDRREPPLDALPCHRRVP